MYEKTFNSDQEFIDHLELLKTNLAFNIHAKAKAWERLQVPPGINGSWAQKNTEYECACEAVECSAKSILKLMTELI